MSSAQFDRTSLPDGFSRSACARRGVRVATSALIIAAVALAGCEADTRRSTVGEEQATIDGEAQPASGEPGASVGNGVFSLRAANRSVMLVEGGGPVSVALTLTREAGFDRPVTLAAEVLDAAERANLSWQFTNSVLAADQDATELVVALDIGAAPIPLGERTLRVVATDGNSTPVVSDVVLHVTPTARPDVYLLVGQSNMVGFSEPNARQAGAGEPDAPDARILQLNVTGNDTSNFATAADFTDDGIAAASPVLPLALDPLHAGYDVTIGGKNGGFIGPGLSFAKAALTDTSATIVLVPAAWSDTGFCRRGQDDPNRLAQLGWLSQPLADPIFSGTLLHDRAIARANLALQQSEGILRGIIWHQGEADVNDVECAVSYGDNLRNLVASLRTNIQADARGNAARGPQANIPFVVGTMSKGADARGDQSPFSDTKLIVDGVHRGVAAAIPHSGFVNNDDLVPPGFACGEGSCIHFGGAALREMGARYYARMRELAAAGD